MFVDVLRPSFSFWAHKIISHSLIKYFFHMHVLTYCNRLIIHDELRQKHLYQKIYVGSYFFCFFLSFKLDTNWDSKVDLGGCGHHVEYNINYCYTLYSNLIIFFKPKMPYFYLSFNYFFFYLLMPRIPIFSYYLHSNVFGYRIIFISNICGIDNSFLYYRKNNYSLYIIHIALVSYCVSQWRTQLF